MKARLISIKLFLMQHLFVVGLVLLFVVLSFCSCGRARAAEPYDGVSVDPYNINSLEDALGYMNITSSQKQTILDAFEQYCPYYQIYFDDDHHSMAVNGTNVAGQYVTCPFVDSNPWRCAGMYYLAKADITPTYILLCKIQDSSVALYFKTPGAQGDYMNVFNGNFQSIYGSEQTFLQYYDNTGDVIISGDVSPQSTAGTLYCYSIEGQHVLMQDNYSYVRPLGESPVYGYSDSHKFFIREQPSYTEDERLKFSTSLRGDGEKLLNTDLSDFLHWNDEGDTQSVYNVSLTLDCDGTEVVVPLDSNNSEVVFTRNISNYTYRCVYITPFSELGLDEYDDVTIVKCDFNRVTVNPNAIGFDEEFKIACNYVLRYETAPIEKEDIEYDDDTETVKVTTAEITAKNDVVNMQNYYYSYTGGGGEELVIPDGFTVKIVTCVDNTSLADAINQLVSWRLLYNSFGSLYDIGEAAILEVTSISNSDDFLAFMEDEIKANSYGDYYDIVCYYYCPDAASAEVDQFYYYITSSGKLRTVNQTLADIWVECNQTSYNTYSIYDFMYTRLNDFEDKSLVAFNSLIGLDRQQVQWLSTLNNTLDNGFYSVVAAINNIDIPEPTVFDDTDILDKLDDLLTAVQDLIDGNEVDTPQECIQYYYDNQDGTIDVAFVPAYYEGMTLDFLYSIQGETQNNNRSGSRSGGGSATFVNDTLIIQIFQQFKDSFSQNYIPQNIRVFLSNITNDTGNHLYYFQLFHDDYDPEDFDGLAD